MFQRWLYFQRALRRIEPHVHVSLARRLEGVWTWAASLCQMILPDGLYAKLIATHVLWRLFSIPPSTLLPILTSSRLSMSDLGKCISGDSGGTRERKDLRLPRKDWRLEGGSPCRGSGPQGREPAWGLGSFHKKMEWLSKDWTSELFFTWMTGKVKNKF